MFATQNFRGIPHRTCGFCSAAVLVSSKKNMLMACVHSQKLGTTIFCTPFRSSAKFWPLRPREPAVFGSPSGSNGSHHYSSLRPAGNAPELAKTKGRKSAALRTRAREEGLKAGSTERARLPEGSTLKSPGAAAACAIAPRSKLHQLGRHERPPPRRDPGVSLWLQSIRRALSKESHLRRYMFADPSYNGHSGLKG